MARMVKCGLLQLAFAGDSAQEVGKIREALLARHVPYIERAAREGVKILCFQELCTGPYFPPSQDAKWYSLAERVPEGPTTRLMQELAAKHGIVLIVPLYEWAMAGIYYNTAAVIDADGRLLGCYRKNHIPQVAGFWEKFFFKPGNLGYPVFDTAAGLVGVYICYDRHFPEGARLLGLGGAEIVFNPSATVTGLSRYLWKLEQPAHAVANGYFVGAINRVGVEAPWNIGTFYGTSYFCDPRGRILVEAGEEGDELVTAELDLDQIEEVRRIWQFYRDRRPETYDGLVRLQP